jgi:hypothetical protein
VAVADPGSSLSRATTLSTDKHCFGQVVLNFPEAESRAIVLVEALGRGI